jgi:hypothetical protein
VCLYILGALAYQAPELIRSMEEHVEDAEIDEEVPMDDSPMVEEILSDKLTTKTDVYAFAMVALEVCSVLDIICKGGAFRPTS